MEIRSGLDVATYSIARAQTRVEQSVGTAMLKKALDLQEMQGDQLVQMMEQSVNPGLGCNIDIRV